MCGAVLRLYKSTEHLPVVQMALFNPLVFSSIWQFVSARDLYKARLHTTRSRRNARWLVNQVEKWSYIEASDSPTGPYTSERFPAAVPGVTDEQWDEFKRFAWQ